MVTEAIDRREIQLEGSVNFRDLGGLITTNGEMVRRGMVFRSDALHGLTESDLLVLEAYRLATLLDLRSDIEITKSGPSPLVAFGTKVLHCPVMTTTTAPEDVDLSQPMEVMYGRFLAGGVDTFATVFTLLARAEHLPTVIHCAAGKDRTGVTVALLLRVLGVADDIIAVDYGMTDRNMTRLKERLAATMTDQDVTKYPPHVMRALPTTMESFLKTLDETYGSADDFLIQAGVGASELDAIRQRLLQPTS